VRERLDDILGLFTGFLREAQAVRRLGSAAIDLGWVAAGRMDGFWEKGLQAWDTTAGALMVEEAGGRVTALDGGVFQPASRQCLASNGLIHDAMLDVVRRVQRP
jgi:myo-inositol-1(or 4)-monophosphatase